MFALPLLDFPYGHYTMSADWHLPGGRSGDQHHLFPVPVPGEADAKQGPMQPADYYKTDRVDIELQIAVGNTLLGTHLLITGCWIWYSWYTVRSLYVAASLKTLQ